MRVAVVNPPFMDGRFSRTSRSPAINKSGTLYWPFWLAHGVGTLERAGHKVLFLDCPARGIGLEELIGQLDEFAPALLVLDTSTPSINSDTGTARAIRRRHPETFIVMVGTHASALPGETLQSIPQPAGVALGEYDITLVELAGALQDGNSPETVPGLLLMMDGEQVTTADRQQVADLDSLPMLADVYRRHLDPHDYFFAAARYPSVMTITSRGCPYRCSFCLWPHVLHRGAGYRVRSPGHVAEEFLLFREYFPEVREVVIEDDTFAVNDERVEEVAAALIRAGNRLPWSANVRATLSLEAMRKMKAAGCRLLIVGYESGNQGILDGVGKGTRIEQSYQFATRARKAGLLVHGCFMAGNVGETRDTLEQTLRMAIELRPDTAQFFPLMVYPGTADYERLSGEGCIRATSYDQWVTPEGLHNCVVDLPTLSAAELVSWCNHARRRFYLRPGYILYKLLQTILHPITEGRRTLKAFRTFRHHIFRT